MRKGYLTAPVIIILALITLAVAFVVYFNTNLIKQAKNQPELQSQTQTKPSTAPSTSPAADEITNWKTYEGKYAIFKYPPDWRFSSAHPGYGGTVYDYVRFDIPDVSHFSVGDSAADYKEASEHALKTQPIIESKEIAIDGRKGVAYKRQTENSFSYDLMAPGSENVGSFSIHVTVDLNYRSRNDLFITAEKIATTVKFLK